ncbi:sulfurtransferase [Brenneria tiliae]|uniref:Rhodanese domain-containing protein n=1 Tax=Brenneria tiliae TaxID=2914984 RepID=A0ABT0MPN6_9GAMM|nr:rhodanese-like domain-containing protein [Brenneria tiliae]MCL2891794.1 hypothetical protein [Brenneria tiliae]
MTSSALSPFISRLPADAALLFVTEESTLPDNLIPGSLPTWIATHYAGKGGGERGRLPLPERAAVQAWLEQAGIDDGTDIVVYDAGKGSHAARAWWVLNWAGHHRVSILDGGLKGWRQGDPRTDKSAAPPAGFFQQVTTEEIARNPGDFLLLDARNKSVFAGDGVVPSHLPGAINLPVASLQDEQGRLLPYEQRKRLAASLNLSDSPRPVVAYCGSGIASAWLVAALQDVGVNAALYVGSWSAWSGSFPSR